MKKLLSLWSNEMLVCMLLLVFHHGSTSELAFDLLHFPASVGYRNGLREEVSVNILYSSSLNI